MYMEESVWKEHFLEVVYCNYSSQIYRDFFVPNVESIQRIHWLQHLIFDSCEHLKLKQILK